MEVCEVYMQYRLQYSFFVHFKRKNDSPMAVAWSFDCRILIHHYPYSKTIYYMYKIINSEIQKKKKFSTVFLVLSVAQPNKLNNFTFNKLHNCCECELQAHLFSL